MDLRKNKKAQTGIFYLLMIGVIMFIIGFELTHVFVTNNQQVRDNMDCNNDSIETYQKVTCGVVDIIAPFVVGLIFGLGGIVFGARIGLGG